MKIVKSNCVITYPLSGDEVESDCMSMTAARVQKQA